MDEDKISLLNYNAIKHGSKVLPTDSAFTNIDADTEWIKWLGYHSKEEKDKLKKIENKKAKDLSYDEICFLQKEKKNEIYLKLIKNYCKDGSEFEDNIKAYKFMKNNSIYYLILSKLNKKEIEEANTKIKKYSDLDEENLNEKINSLSDKDFNNLSMVDSYVLHALSDVEFERNSEEAENRLAYYERQYCGITGDKSDGRKVI